MGRGGVDGDWAGPSVRAPRARRPARARRARRPTRARARAHRPRLPAAASRHPQPPSGGGGGCVGRRSIDRTTSRFSLDVDWAGPSGPSFSLDADWAGPSVLLYISKCLHRGMLHHGDATCLFLQSGGLQKNVQSNSSSKMAKAHRRRLNTKSYVFRCWPEMQKSALEKQI